jgi:hypothetical protein
MWGWGGWGAALMAAQWRPWAAIGRGGEAAAGAAGQQIPPEGPVDPGEAALGHLRRVQDPLDEDLGRTVAHVATVPLFVVTDPTTSGEYSAGGQGVLENEISPLYGPREAIGEPAL